MSDEQQPKMTLANLLTFLGEADTAGTMEFDPEQLVGDLRDKIDSIHHVLTKLEAQEEWNRKVARPFQNAALALKRNRERLDAYVVRCMEQGHFQMIPGQLQKVRLRDSPVALKLLKDIPDADDFLKYPQYVEPIRAYEWKKAAIKSDLIAGTLKFETPTDAFATLTQGHWVEFVPNTPQVEGKKK